MNKIGIFDSGIGGISILKELQNTFPNEEYIYYADYINNPYGEKTKKELIKIGSNIIDILINNKCNIIVIACNTMTIAALEELKKLYPNISILGITPPIKEACNTSYKNMLLMATPFTIKSKYVNDNVKQYKKDNQNIILLDSKRLAPLIETYNLKDIKEYLNTILKDYKNIDSIILGCTHYSLIKDIIKSIINKPIIDNTSLISNELKDLIIPNDKKIIKEVIYLNSLNKKETYSDIINKIKNLNGGNLMSKLIVIEGTDCSGKETQSNLLEKRLNNENIPSKKLSFPMYETPTGRIIGGPYLGKKLIGEGFFEEGASNVPAKVASLYFAADRKYNIPKVYEYLDKGHNVILDRYIESNMAHQGGKIKASEERFEMYDWLNKLEYGLLELPRPDLTILLYVPHQFAQKLKASRAETPDQHEADLEYLKLAETAYLELADLHGFKTVECVKDDKMRSIEDINDDVYKIVMDLSLEKNKQRKL